MDRINLQIVVHHLKPGEMTEQTTGEASKSIRDRVTVARDRARSRFKPDSQVSCNAEMRSHHLREFCQLDDSSRNLLEGAIRKLGLSAN